MSSGSGISDWEKYLWQMHQPTQCTKCTGDFYIWGFYTMTWGMQFGGRMVNNHWYRWAVNLVAKLDSDLLSYIATHNRKVKKVSREVDFFWAQWDLTWRVPAFMNNSYCTCAIRLKGEVLAGKTCLQSLHEWSSICKLSDTVFTVSVVINKEAIYRIAGEPFKEYSNVDKWLDDLVWII